MDALISLFRLLYPAISGATSILRLIGSILVISRLYLEARSALRFSCAASTGSCLAKMSLTVMRATSVMMFPSTSLGSYVMAVAIVAKSKMGIGMEE